MTTNVPGFIQRIERTLANKIVSKSDEYSSQVIDNFLVPTHENNWEGQVQRQVSPDLTTNL